MLYDDKKFIGAKIQEYRKKRKLTQAQLAEKVGLTDKHIGRIEAGTFFPACNKFMHIIDILQINIDEFGINIKPNTSPNKQQALKFIYSMNNEDLDTFLPMIEVFFQTITEIKNSRNS